MTDVSSTMSQVLGLVATLMLLSSYLVKSKKAFLVLGLIGDVAYGLTFIFVNSLGAGLITLLSCVQNLTFFAFESKGKNAPKAVGLLFVALFIVAGISNFNTIYDIIPILCYSFFTLALYGGNVESIKVMYIIPNILLVFYDFMVMAYANAFEDGIEVAFLLVTVISQSIKSKYQNGLKIPATLKINFTREYIGDYTFQSTAKKFKTGDNHIEYLTNLKSVVLANPVNRYG